MTKNITITKELYEKVEDNLSKSGYTSLNEFISDSIKIRIAEIERQHEVGRKVIRDLHKHVWYKLTMEGVYEIGITNYLQNKMRTIVNVVVENVGKYIEENEPFGQIESWMFINDLFSPISGKIVDVNKDVLNNPFTLNEDVYQWIIKVKPIK